ncbi:uncharacterized protein LOC133320300 [Danaus plexippus]|uniref:uncharacterized protein LOC133320300 n=1 Tax=Danaus plexippus TaxID=13037 RepID=UPI002AAF4201|nr:uncharacterized protein LOC133320300 [Danaus plexippus]
MVLYFFEYVFYVLKTLSVVDMISHIIQVKFRLKTIGDILKDYCSHIDNVSFSETIKKSGNNIKDSEFLSYNYRHISLSLSRCYFLLTEQCNFINAMYGLRIFLIHIIVQIDMVVMINLMIRLMFKIEISETNWFHLLIVVIKIIAAILIICTWVHCCEQNYRQTERIIYWSNNLTINKIMSPEVGDAIDELKSLIHSKPISFHMHHFCKLEYGTLLTIISNTISYVIAMSQNI